jgi:hypothetical protein
MKICLTLASILLCSSFLCSRAIGQVTCACENVSKSTCHGSIKCPEGCTALCAAGDVCYLSCKNDMVGKRLNLKFVNQDGMSIATKLSEETQKTITFTPYPKRQNERYTYELKNQSMWTLLNYLNKRGSVRVNGMEFRRFRKMKREAQDGSPLAARFEGMTAQEVMDKLEFLSQVPLRIRSGDPQTIVSVNLRNKTLDQILRDISKQSGVKINRVRRQTQKR